MNRLNIEHDDTLKVAFEKISKTIEDIYLSIEKVYEVDGIDTSLFVKKDDLKEVQDDVNNLKMSMSEIKTFLEGLNNDVKKMHEVIDNVNSKSSDLSDSIDNIYSQLMAINTSVISQNDLIASINKKLT